VRTEPPITNAETTVSKDSIFKQSRADNLQSPPAPSQDAIPSLQLSYTQNGFGYPVSTPPQGPQSSFAAAGANGAPMPHASFGHPAGMPSSFGPGLFPVAPTAHAMPPIPPFGGHAPAPYQPNLYQHTPPPVSFGHASHAMPPRNDFAGANAFQTQQHASTPAYANARTPTGVSPPQSTSSVPPTQQRQSSLPTAVGLPKKPEVELGHVQKADFQRMHQGVQPDQL
jgi:hypothetical protein